MASLEIDKKRVLGRGLASLIPDANPDGSITPKREFLNCDIEKIVPNTYQPRKIFDKDALDELSQSIRIHGVIQPLIVRRRDGHYELIAGERRWRAAQKAGLKQVPIVIKDVTGDIPSLELAVIENIQRQDLNCIEEAIAYQQLTDEFQLSQEDIATRVGKNRVTIANTMRLLKLPSAIREDITAERLTMGHARALLSLESADEQLAVREFVIQKKLSVRETERKVNEVLRAKKTETGGEKPKAAHMAALEDELRRRYGTNVRFVGNESRGFIQFTYATREDLMRIVDLLKGENATTPPQSV